MCGLIFSSGNFKLQSFLLGYRNIKHRGPEDSKTFFFDSIKKKKVNIKSLDKIKTYKNLIGIGHHRLKIVDLNSSAQPMFFDNLVIAYNGEIYNFKEIRKKLIGFGYKFKTKGDTEVVLKSYHKWGAGCEKYFNGMWAFVVYDLNKNNVYASRDRLGVKPLYFYKDKKQLIIASEIKAILPFFNKIFANKKEVIKYLIYGAQENEPQTLFKNIKRILPGNYLLLNLNNNKIVLKKNISFKEMIKARKINQKTYKNDNNLKNLIIDALRIRTEINLPYVITLSGGVDSNILTSAGCLMKKNFKSVSATYGNNIYSENDLINLTVKKYKLKHEYVKISNKDIIKNLRKIIWYQDEPFDTMGIYAQNLVYKKIKDMSIKVAIDGQGADEIFAGYPTSDPAYINELSFMTFLNSIIRGADYTNFSSLKILILSKMPKLFEKIYFYKRAKNIFCNKIKFIASSSPGKFRFKSLKDKCKSDIKEHLSVLLRYLDRNSMQYSIESRGPFLDYRVVDVAIDQNLNNSYYNDLRKSRLRASFKNIVDEKILFNKKKKGFAVPENEWLNSKIVSKFTKHIINKSKILKELNINKSVSLKTDYRWRVTALAIWESEFNILGFDD
jgi:asparagine synthase (glutamine-hydrolysing)